MLPRPVKDAKVDVVKLKAVFVQDLDGFPGKTFLELGDESLAWFVYFELQRWWRERRRGAHAILDSFNLEAGGGSVAGWRRREPLAAGRRSWIHNGDGRSPSEDRAR